MLGTIAKALSGSDGLSHDIWALHESPFVRSLVELFSSRGLLQLDKVQTELKAWVAGKRFIPNGLGVDGRPVLSVGRLDANELALVRIYLENLPPEKFTAADWSLLVDYLVSRYMPPKVAYSEAEWLTVRSTFMGKVQANIANLNAAQAEGLVAALPSTVAEAKREFSPSPSLQAIIDFGLERCADNITAINDATRHRIKRVIMNHEEQRLLGDRPPESALQTQLVDEFAALNRDWRRIALTEVAENAGNGMIASVAPGGRVRRVEQYVGSCDFCRKIHGRIFTVVSPDKKDKNWDTEVWVGKSNIGRSGAKMKRTDDGLVPRAESELWTVPAGPVHPHCRGIWVPVEDAKPTDDPSFAKWLDAHFAKHRRSAEQLAESFR
ncbi:hypothetical protein [Pararobbsia silviterrae]|uniref:hypothetical protein n=1 Tax=Pararobbsia silviterrae TaxID=1792498 RepID=UPI0011C48DAD|nr:hypothetical protein [Pararobbsia silviterrae]